MDNELEDILLEMEASGRVGDLVSRYSSFFNKIAARRDFFPVVQSKLEHVLATGNIPRFDLLSYLIQAHARGSKDQKAVWVLMMDFIVKYQPPGNEVHPAYEEVMTTVLDLFWHQMEPLTNLDGNEQQKLGQLLEIAANFKYQITEYRDEPFFAINKSMDLIKFVKDHAQKDRLVSLYRNHFDPLVRERLEQSVSHKDWL